MFQEVTHEGSIKIFTRHDLSDSFGRYLIDGDPAGRMLYGFRVNARTRTYIKPPKRPLAGQEYPPEIDAGKADLQQNLILQKYLLPFN